MATPRRNPAALPHHAEEGPTLLFQRTAVPGPRCFACPYRHVPEDMSRRPSLAPTILPIPPLHGPRAAPITPLPARPQQAAPCLPRPSLLPAIDPHATLLLPDALKPGGPEAATVMRPVGPPGPASAMGGDGATRLDRMRPGFDELASPDITMMQQAQQVQPAARPPRAPPRRRATPDGRAYFLLNLCLGLLIVGGLAILVTREVATPVVAEDHAQR